MAREVVLPRVDMDMATGRMGRWFVDEGERVSEGQPLFSVEADAAAVEVEAPASGLLRGVRAKGGDVLPVGAVVGWIVGEDEAFDPDLQALAGELRALLASSAPPAAATAPAEAPAPAAAPSPPAAGARLHREWLQRGEGAPLAFLHGFGADLDVWRPLTARLPTPRPALALDLPGHGGSPLVGAPSFAALVAAAREALAEEGIGAAHLIGHCLGGAVAAALAAEPGFRALSLMLIAPAGLGPEINSPFLDGFLRARSAASLTPWMRLLVADPVSLGAELVETILRRREQGALVEAQARLAEALFPDGVQAFGVRHFLADPAMPTKIVWGAQDQIIRARQCEGLNGLIAIHRLAGVGHMPQLEAARETARLAEELARAGG